MPTVFDGVANDMRIAREEIFGPVVSVIPFDTEEEALRLANATPYGLSGSIWSRDIGQALRAAKALQAGVISVNSNSSVHTEAPFGGYKMSGIGRELGMARARPLHRDEERLHRPELSRGSRRRPSEVAGRRARRRVTQATQSRSAQWVVLNAMPSHGIASGANARISSASGFGAASPPTIRASNAIDDDRRLEPRVQPDDLARLDEQAGLLERLADRRLGRRSRRPRGSRRAGPTQPLPGSMPRRRSTTSPSSVIGIVVTTRRGLT